MDVVRFDPVSKYLISSAPVCGLLKILNSFIFAKVLTDEANRSDNISLPFGS